MRRRSFFVLYFFPRSVRWENGNRFIWRFVRKGTSLSISMRASIEPGPSPEGIYPGHLWHQASPHRVEGFPRCSLEFLGSGGQGERCWRWRLHELTCGQAKAGVGCLRELTAPDCPWFPVQAYLPPLRERSGDDRRRRSRCSNRFRTR